MSASATQASQTTYRVPVSFPPVSFPPMDVDPEQEADIAVVVPAIEMRGLAEVGVAAEADPLEASPPAQGDRFVDVGVDLFVRGAVATAIDQIERLASVSQRDDRGMITPNSVVGHVDALLALGIGAGDGAIDIDDRLVEEVGGLLGPDPQPSRKGGFAGSSLFFGFSESDLR